MRRDPSARGYDFVLSGDRKTVSTVLRLKSSKLKEVVELTSQAKDFVSSSGVRNGLLSCFIRHTTAALVLANRREGVGELLTEVLHDAFEEVVEDKAGRISREPEIVGAYLLSAVLGSSVIIPVQNGRCAMGDWQGLYLIEMSGPREREVAMTLVGL